MNSQPAKTIESIAQAVNLAFKTIEKARGVAMLFFPQIPWELLDGHPVYSRGPLIAANSP
jgi:hypothetical protein